jgi:hypothetical protein
VTTKGKAGGDKEARLQAIKDAAFERRKKKREEEKVQSDGDDGDFFVAKEGPERELEEEILPSFSKKKGGHKLRLGPDGMPMTEAEARQS